jgi:hypothetical protein
MDRYLFGSKSELAIIQKSFIFCSAFKVQSDFSSLIYEAKMVASSVGEWKICFKFSIQFRLNNKWIRKADSAQTKMCESVSFHWRSLRALYLLLQNSIGHFPGISP